jgi:hypothetical protein
MLKSRIYIIVQVLAILLVICGYFLSDQPDSLSVMHFDPNPACPSVITKAVKSNVNGFANQTTVSSQNTSNHKTNIPRFISYEIVLPRESAGYIFNVLPHLACASALPQNYSYLFYEEINPPPPKAFTVLV